FAANGGSVSTVMKPLVPKGVFGFTPICKSWLVENGPLGTLNQVLLLPDKFHIRPCVELGMLASTCSVVAAPDAKPMFVGVAEKTGGSVTTDPNAPLTPSAPCNPSIQSAPKAPPRD